MIPEVNLEGIELPPRGPFRPSEAFRDVSLGGQLRLAKMSRSFLLLFSLGEKLLSEGAVRILQRFWDELFDAQDAPDRKNRIVDEVIPIFGAAHVSIQAEWDEENGGWHIRAPRLDEPQEYAMPA